MMSSGRSSSENSPVLYGTVRARPDVPIHCSVRNSDRTMSVISEESAWERPSPASVPSEPALTE